ncbi:hypothetical protein C8Q74DRAFT_490246 [Fomes fomentarius]|nr:hypothetical protein C8Q74DRAFT_490246 [Fomes fomentarius]
MATRRNQTLYTRVKVESSPHLPGLPIDTYRAAIASVNVTLSAAYALATSDQSLHHGVFALARPPGHHAQDALSGGYCFLNNVAIAARYLLQHFGTRRVAVLDVDYHHGNGTQQIFYSDPRVVYVSLHADGDYPWPGLGFNYNFPLPTGTTDEVYCVTLQNAADVIGDYEDIDYLIDCYARIGMVIASLGKPTLFVMEGGYHLDTLGENVRGVLLGFQAETRE